MIDVIYTATLIFVILLFAIFIIPIAQNIFNISIDTIYNITRDNNILIVKEPANKSYNYLIYVFVATVFGLSIIGVILSFMHVSHPIFIVAGIIFIIIGTLLGTIFRDILIMIIQQNDIVNNFVAKYPWLSIFIQNLHIFVMVNGVLIVIAQLIAKYK